VSMMRPSPGARAAERRSRAARLAAAGALALALAWLAVTAGARPPAALAGTGGTVAPSGSGHPSGPGTGTTTTPPPALRPGANTVGLRVLTFVDRTRTARFHTGAVEPRTLVTQVRYPARGEGAGNDVPDAAVLRAAGPYPLIVFGPGFAETGTIYKRLLDAWARAGYVVAAPAFPLTQTHVPGGRRERDLINQPADMSFVITSMLAEDAKAGSFLHGLIDRRLVAIAGQSDGAATALAAAYDPSFADPRIRAAMILSGAELTLIDDDIPFPTEGPPLLAVQGTEDPLNEPSATRRYFELAPEPKFLLMLLGASHLPPYTSQQPYLGVVEEVTIAFLDHYLRDDDATIASIRELGNITGVARLTG